MNVDTARIGLIYKGKKRHLSINNKNLHEEYVFLNNVEPVLVLEHDAKILTRDNPRMFINLGKTPENPIVTPPAFMFEHDPTPQQLDVASHKDMPDFYSMTKNELIKYCGDIGLQVPPAMSKYAIREKIFSTLPAKPDRAEA